MPQISTSIKKETIDAIHAFREYNDKRVRKMIPTAEPSSFSEIAAALLNNHPALQPFIKKQSKK